MDRPCGVPMGPVRPRRHRQHALRGRPVTLSRPGDDDTGHSHSLGRPRGRQTSMLLPPSGLARSASRVRRERRGIRLRSRWAARLVDQRYGGSGRRIPSSGCRVGTPPVVEGVVGAGQEVHASVGPSGDGGLALRRRVGMALVVVGQPLPEGGINGGSAMALRFGRATRFTQDFDSARHSVSIRRWYAWRPWPKAAAS